MDSIVGKQIIGILILFLLVIPTHGCIILPIPTPAHGGYGVIINESIASLEPEKATRADVLLRIGDPAERLHQDRFFVYRWERTHGYLIWAIGGAGPSGGVGDINPLTANHFLLIEFLPDNRIKRSKFIDSKILSQRAREQLDELIQEWDRSSSGLE
jgi:hypothetical protein